MFAALIFALARTSRCAMVASGTTKARAISVVSSPPSSRRVSAIWAVGARAGWQQVKMSRSRSSGTGLTSSVVSSAGSDCVASPPGYTSSACAYRCSRVAARRAARLRGLGAPGERGVEVRRLDDPETAELLLGLRERPVGGDHLAVLYPDRGGRRRRVQPAGEHPRAGLLELIVDHVHVLVHLLHFLGGRLGLALDHVHGEKVRRHRS